MTNEFSEPEVAILTVAQKQIDDAQAAVAAAQADYQRKAAAVEKARNALGALGAVPDASAFDDSAAWQAATAEHQFQSARLQRDVLAGEGPMNEAAAAMPVLQEAAVQAERAKATALAHIQRDRLSAALPILPALAARFWEARKAVSVGEIVEMPRGVSIADAGFGMTRLTITTVYDHRNVLEG